MASNNLKKYIWETQIVPQLGYSFSTIHSTGYSLTALQMMNLAHHYPSVVWDTACLTISAQANEENIYSRNSNYGRVASAIGKIKGHGTTVMSPSINKSRLGFVPDVENNAIVFGLKGIQGINDETIRTIISNRPYTSFEDFYDRMYSLKHVTRKQMLMLIKAGAFNEFNSSVEVMKEFLVKETPVKNILNGQNMSRIINLGLFNNEKNRRYQEYFNFRNYLKKNVHERLTNPKNRVLAIKDGHSKLFFESNFSDESIYGFLNDWILIDEKKFDTEYKEKMSSAMELLKDKEFVRKFNIAQFYELWNEFASGTVESWYFEATSFYPEKHELESVDTDLYSLRNFSDLSEQPVVLGERKLKNGRVFQELELYNIVGTVLDKNKNSHSVTVLTREGDVVHVKTYAGAYAHYDRQIKHNGKIVEKSWFTRGELLMLTGFRRDDQFVLKAPYGQHTVNRITEIREDGSLGLQSERFRA